MGNAFKYYKLQIKANEKKQHVLLRVLEHNPFGQGIINCKDVDTATKLRNAIPSSKLMNGANIEEAKGIINAYNDGTLQYIITHKFSPNCVFKLINNDKLRIIVNYRVRAKDFLRRISITKEDGNAKKVYVI